MWHSATAAAVALLQQHLFFGGLGGVIAVIVGGVVSVITLRNANRSAARPAPIPSPAPASRRPTTPASYGEPAPPTSPARRLHPGSIAMREPTSPTPASEDAEPSANLFDPDLFSTGSGGSSHALRARASLASEWRAQAEPIPDVTHAPVWNTTPFGGPDTSIDIPVNVEPLPAIDPPIWRAGYLGERLRLTDTPMESAALPMEQSLLAPPPVWSSWLRPPDGAPLFNDAMEARQFDTPATDERATHPPIWPSYLRPE